MKIEPNIDDPMDPDRFPPDPWRLVETYPSEHDLGQTETLFAVANGYLGMRGNPEEGRDSFLSASFINGFHETWQINHAENAYGFATTGQTMVNVPSAQTIKLYVDDEPLNVLTSDIIDYERSLDFRDGILRRSLVYRTASGKRVRVDSSRMVSMADRHLAIMTYEVEMLEGDAPITISSQIVNHQDFDAFSRQEKVASDDPRKNQGLNERVLESAMDWSSPRRMILGYHTVNSGMTLAVGADHTIETENPFEELDATSPDLGRKIYRIEAHQGEPVRITKAVSYHTSRGVPVRELSDRVRRTLDRVREKGIEPHIDAHRRWLGEFWAASDVWVEAAPRVQQTIRWCLFELAQAAARADGQGIPAKGLTGDGYEGHYFWDTEVYVIPFLTYTNPAWARNALRFRTTHLAQARDRARVLSTQGALFPWRTINGEEASAYYAAGTAQYHIDADVAYAIGRYGTATGDDEFMNKEGVTLLVETARMWADLGFWRLSVDDDSTFEIHGVTGPDEYTTVVNNNTYTNVMARHNLLLAVEKVRQLKAEEPEIYRRIVRELDLAEEEVAEWERCAAGMKIPFDEILGIHPQDDAFTQKELWDLDGTPAENFPLLLHYHPLVIYRFQVLKQADVVLALFLRGEEFTDEQKLADFEYYDPITTGDSTLSAVVQSIVAAEVGHQAMALDYFLRGLFVDVGDLHHNTADGVHIASAGGVWHALIHGFGGMRDVNGIFTFDPRLPRQWGSLEFVLRQRDTRMRVLIKARSIKFTVETGEQITVSVRGVEHIVTAEAPVEVRLSDQGIRLPSLASTHPIIGGRRADGTLITAEVPEAGEDRTESIPAIPMLHAD